MHRRPPASSTLAVLALAAAATAAGTGCIAASARVHGGAVTAGGRTGAQVGLTLGLGLTTSRRGAVLANLGFATGDAPRAGLIDVVEYARVPEPDADVKVVLRGGLGGVIALSGDPGVVGLHLAPMIVLRDKGSSWSGHEKLGGGGWSRSLLGVGLEARGGFATTEVADPAPGAQRTRTDPGGSLSLTVEYLRVGQSSLF